MLLNLPTELQLMITNHLPLQDAINLAQTCQGLFQRLIVPLYRRETSKVIGWAARAGHERTLVIALKAWDQEHGSRRAAGSLQNALALAACAGHETIVERLSCRTDMDLDCSTGHCFCGLSPLPCAARKGHEAVVQLLLQMPGIRPNHEDNGFPSALIWAVWGAHKEVVRLLLRRDDLDVNARHMGDTNEGRTALSYAAAGTHQGILSLLPEHQIVQADLADCRLRTPLMYAAAHGQHRNTELLLEGRDVNPNRCDDDGRTALSWAAESGRENTVRLLLQSSDVDVNLADVERRSPLWYAVRSGREAVVEALLHHPDNQVRYGTRRRPG